VGSADSPAHLSTTAADPAAGDDDHDDHDVRDHSGFLDANDASFDAPSAPTVVVPVQAMSGTVPTPPFPTLGTSDARAIEAWVARMNAVFNVHGDALRDDERRYKVAVCYLTDAMATWPAAMGFGDDAKWSTFSSALLSSATGSTPALLTELADLRQTEGIKAHYLKVVALLDRLRVSNARERGYHLYLTLAPEFKADLATCADDALIPSAMYARLVANFGDRAPSRPALHAVGTRTSSRAVGVADDAELEAALRADHPTRAQMDVLKRHHRCTRCKAPWSHSHLRVCPKANEASSRSSRSVSSSSSPSASASVPSLSALSATFSAFYVDASVDGALARVLIDTGASRNFISTVETRRRGLSARGEGSTFYLADGSAHRSPGMVTLPLTIAGFASTAEFLIADIDCPIILGNPWLTFNAAVIDCASRTLTFSVPRGSKLSTMRHHTAASVEPWCQVVRTERLEDGDAHWLCVIQVRKADVRHPRLESVVAEFADVFPDALPLELPPDRGGPFRITLVPGSSPRLRPMRRFSPADMDALAKEITALLEAGLIKPSDSPFGAQVLFVAKKDGTRRMCIDYRSLNEDTIRDAYPLPRIDDLLDRLAGAKWFSKLDLRSAYHQMRVHPDDTHKTAFRTPMGSFEFLVLPYGVQNAPAAFSRMMDQVLPAARFRAFTSVYIDDLLIFSKTLEEHVEHLRVVLDLLRRNKLYVKGSKSVVGAQEVEFLGFLITPDGVRADPAKVDAIRGLRSPATPKEVRSALGMFGYFRHFIKGYASLAAVLETLVKKDAEFVWSADHQAAFDALKVALSTAPVLRVYNQALPITVQTDACDAGLGAVLLQDGHPVAYASRKLHVHERAYSVQEKEGLAIVFAVRKWEHYLRGVEFRLETDHKSLVYLKTSKDPTHRIARWLDLLANYAYVPVYRPGETNGTADALSRLAVVSAADPPAAPVALAVVTSSPVVDASLVADIKAGYDDDNYFAPVAAALLRDEPIKKGYAQRVSYFSARDGLLFFTSHGESRLAVPNVKRVRDALLAEAHAAPMAGHLGMEATYRAMTARFFWPRMARQVERFVAGCDPCQRTKAVHGAAPGLLRPLPTPARPWDVIGIDFVTDLPVSAGYDAFLTVTDHFSRMVHVIPTTKTVTASESADLLVRHVVRLHGLPLAIVSDRDPRFTSELWQALFESLGTELRMSTADHPQTNGLTERMNGLVLQLIRTCCIDHPHSWAYKLPLLEFAINSHASSATTVSPFQACYGYAPRMPLDLLAANNTSMPMGLRDVDNIHRLVRDSLSDSKDRMSVSADEHRRPVEYKAGDKVYLTADRAATTDATDKRKLRPRFRGPYPIVKVLDNAVELKLPPGSRLHPVFNVSKVKLWHPPATPQPKPGPVIDDDGGDDEYEVEDILREEVMDGAKHYLVRWKGYGPEDDSFVAEDDLFAPEVLAQFKKRSQS